MARVDIPVTQIVQEGVAPPAQIAADTVNQHSLINNGRTFLEVVNVNATTAVNVTLITPGNVSGLAIADLIISIPLSGTRLIGPIDVGLFTTLVSIDAGTADLRFRAYRL